MEWLLYIIGGIFVFSLLWHIGIIPEFIAIIGVSLVMGCLGGLFSWLIVDKSWNGGFEVGVIVGLVLYGIYCISRIIDPTITIEYFNDNSREITSERGKGIVGLLALIGLVIYGIVV